MKRVSYYFMYPLMPRRSLKSTYLLRGGDLEVTQSFTFVLHKS